MRAATRFAVALGLGLVAAVAHAQERPVVLEVTPVGNDAPLKDLTPAELLHEPHVHHAPEPPAGGLYAAAEFLLLTPRQRNLDFAIVDPSNNLTPNGRIQSLNYETQPGFRATLAYRVPGHGWDIGLTYTYFNSRDDFATTAGPGGLIYPTLTKAGLTNDAQGALARARLTMNVYDIELGRRWDVDDTLRFRLVGGVRLMTVRQSLEAVYDGRDADLAFVRTESNFDGAGPMAGVESSWALTKTLGVFGRATGGLVTGTMRNPFVETNNGGATTYADVADRYALTVPFAALGIGLSYEYRGLFLRAGYEVTNYFGLFERQYYVDDFAEGKTLNRSSNLALDGLFLQFGLAF
jgi:hypothetical protein